MFQNFLGRKFTKEYPSQFWVMVVGLFISSAGASMIWPFMMIYASEKLNLTLSAVSTLITVNAVVGLFASFIAGAIADKVGRKPVMVISLAVNGLSYFFMSYANSYLEFAIIMVFMGASNPLYQVGSDAMLADLIIPERRSRAFAIIRMVNNAGIAVGPAVGGFVAAHSYSAAFVCAAVGMFCYSMLLLFKARETLDEKYHEGIVSWRRSLSEYGLVFKDVSYIIFALLIGLGLIAPSMLWTLLSVYTKQNFGLPENLYGWLPTTNALMCVLVQYPITQLFRKTRPLSIITLGVLVYALGVGSVFFMHSFWGFWSSMVLMTLGELILLPTASKYIADLAPEDMRGRYMSFYWFAWGIARGVAPLIGGFMNDKISPQSIWLAALAIGLTSTLGLLVYRSRRIKTTVWQ
jgi:MFS family permease